MNRRETEEFADWFCKKYDEMYFDFMNKILTEVRRENNIAQIGSLAINAELTILHDPSVCPSARSDEE